MSATPAALPRRAWYCRTCENVTFEKGRAQRDDYHAHGWGPDGISRCPGRWTAVTLVLGHANPGAPIRIHTPPPVPPSIRETAADTIEGLFEGTD